jgi:hypothetical protein
MLETDLTLPVHQHHQRTVDFAHRQLLAATKTLAKVRKAKLPDVLALVNVRRVSRPGERSGHR